MDEKELQQAQLAKEVTPYVAHLTDKLQAPQQQNPDVVISRDGASHAEQIVNNQQYAFQKPLRTFESDVAETIKSQNVSVAKIAIAEKVREEKVQQIAKMNALPEQNHSGAKKNILLFLASIVLVGGALYLLYMFYYLPRQTPTVTPKLTVASLITPDSQKEIPAPTTKDVSFIDILKAARDKDALPQNSIEHLYITEGEGSAKGLMTSQKFLSLLPVEAPEQYLRTLEPEFMFGVHSFNGNNPFLILKTDTYQTAFAGMLKWEATMADDLGPLFIKNQATNKPFIDLVIKNKDIRALTNEYDRIILLYTFLDKETILITTNEFTLKEILDRMTNRKFVR